MNQGWQCPVCGRVNAPLVAACPCQVHESRPPWRDPGPEITPFAPVVPSRTIDPRLASWTVWCGRPIAAESRVAFE